MEQYVVEDIHNIVHVAGKIPASILHKCILGRYRPVRIADGPIKARYRFIKNASWDSCKASCICNKSAKRLVLFKGVRTNICFYEK